MNIMERKFSIAPMLDKTDRHYRYFARLLTHHALLYTEMITVDTILKGDTHYHLKYHSLERPLALQLGGNDPEKMSQCAIIASDYGYDEVNINVGCPSHRAQSGQFGACLMTEPERIAECVSAMTARTHLPVTIKTRIGIDHDDRYETLHYFIDTIAAANCGTFIIHARKAWLDGLSPKKNREIPPLRYDVVYRLKEDFPQLKIIINGGIKTLAEAANHLQQVDGVMIGREAYSNPYLLGKVDQQFYGSSAVTADRKTILTRLLPYLEMEVADGTKMRHMTRHILGLLRGMPGARKWRQQLSENPSLTIDELKAIISALS